MAFAPQNIWHSPSAGPLADSVGAIRESPSAASLADSVGAIRESPAEPIAHSSKPIFRACANSRGVGFARKCRGDSRIAPTG